MPASRSSGIRPRKCRSAACVIEPAALPAASTIRWPRGGGSGRFGGRHCDGCAAATAVRNSDSSNSRADAAMIIPDYGKGAVRSLSFYNTVAEDIMATDDKTELEAAVYRRLVEHLRSRTDVQNVDLMNLAGFCRNCLSNWMKDAADAKGLPMTKDESRQIVYGMPYDEWRAKHQNEASADQKAAFEKASQKH